MRRSSESKRAFLAAVAGSLLVAQPSDALAAVRNGQQTIDSTIVYLGIVPAALTRNHTLIHGGTSDRSVHNVHVFDRTTGARITNARVVARFLGERGRKWSVRLAPMTVNGALTYGGYTNLGTNEEASVSIDVRRLFAGKPRTVTARFDYQHD